MKTFHQSVIPLALPALQTVPEKQRHFNSLTTSIPAEAVPQIKVRIETFYRELLGYLDSLETRSGEVCQLNLQFFPLTSAVKDKP